MGNSTSKETKTTSTTTTITTKTTTTTKTKTSRSKKINKKPEVVNTSTVEKAVKLSSNPVQCKAELKSLLGECTQDTSLVDSVAKFFETNRTQIESSAATVAIAGALGLTVLEASSDVGKTVGNALGVHNIGLTAILGGGGVVAASVGAVFSGVAIITTGCLLFKKFRVMQESGRVKPEIFQKIQKLRDDMTDLLEDCNEDKFFKIQKSRFRDLRRQIDVLYVLLHNIVEKLEKERKRLNKAKKWMAALSGIAVVTGVILCFTGIGAAVGAGLVAGGIVGLACAYKLHKAEKQIEKEIEFYRNTFQCIQDLEFILSELERLHTTKLANTKEKFEKRIKYLKDFNKNLFDKYWVTLRNKGLLQENGCEIYVTGKQMTLEDIEKKFKKSFSHLEGEHEDHLWVVVAQWVTEYRKIKGLFSTIFNERKKNVTHNQEQQKEIRNS